MLLAFALGVLAVEFFNKTFQNANSKELVHELTIYALLSTAFGMISMKKITRNIT